MACRSRFGYGGRSGSISPGAAKPNAVWSYDFLHDQLVHGRALKLQRVLDEYTRECLAIKVGCAACAPMTSSSGQLCANAEPASTESTSGAICLSFI